LGEQLTILGPRLKTNDRATTIQKKQGVISDAGAYLEHRFVQEI
jgi:hypothetical protein